jgi:ABC-type transport system involved in cytochrome c biogenesis permease component
MIHIAPARNRIWCVHYPVSIVIRMSRGLPVAPVVPLPIVVPAVSLCVVAVGGISQQVVEGDGIRRRGKIDAVSVVVFTCIANEDIV